MARQGESVAGAGGSSVSGSRRLSLFLRASVFDYVLVLVVSAALVFTVSYGFNSAPDLRGNIAFIDVACAVLLVPLYAGGWSKRAIPFAAVAYVVLAVVVVVVVSALSSGTAELFVDGQVNDVAENYAVFGMVLVAVPPMVYLLSRRTWGVALLLFAGVLACGVIQFLYRDWVATQPGTIAAIAVYAGIGALFMVQGYRQGVLKSRIVKRTSFAGAFAFGVLSSVVCLGLGALVYFGVIAGMGLSTVGAKPFADYFSRPVVEYRGTYQQEPIYDPNVGTSTLSEDREETKDWQLGNAEAPPDSEQGEEGEGNQDSDPGSQQSQQGGGFIVVSAVAQVLDQDQWSEMFDAIRFELPPSLVALLALIPVLLVAAIVYLRYYQRFRRLKKIEEHPLPERVALLYNFFMRGFERLKVEKPATATPIELALSSAGELAGFMRNDSQADLLGVTLIYQRAVYGAGNVSREDYEYVRDYCLSFFRNAHLRMGHPRWAFGGFWRI